MEVTLQGVSAMTQEEVDRMLQELGWRSKLRLTLEEKNTALLKLKELRQVNQANPTEQPGGQRKTEEVDVVLQEVAEYIRNR